MLKSKLSRLICLLLVSVLTIGLVAGCGSADKTTPADSTTAPAVSAESTAAPAASTAEPVKKDVTISFTACADNTWIFPVDETIISDFTNETGIKIDVQKTPADQYASVLKTKFASGEGPDMAMIWAEANAAQFFPEKNFLDLSNEPWVANLTEAAKRNQSYGGKVIGWGAQGGDYGWGMIYSKEIFDKYQLQVPKTFDEFLAVCEKLQANGIVPFNGSLKDQWSVGIWMANIGPLAESKNPGLYDKLNNNTANFADVPEFEAFINNYKELYDKGYLGKNALSGTVNDNLTQITEGKTAMALVNCTPDGWFTSLNLTPDMTKFGMFPAPFANNNTLSAYDGSLIRTININGKNIDACKEYFNYISKSEVLAKYYADPARSSIAPAFTEFADKFVWPDSTKSLIANSDGKNFTIMESGIKYWDNTNFGKYIEEAMLGTKTAKQALESIDNDRKKIFEAAQ